MAGFAKANTRIGFAQVEPNHLSGIVTGQIYAQYPVDTATVGKVLEQGRFVKYDGKTNKVNLTGAGEWMLVYNEEKLPDPKKQNHKDFALQAADMTEGIITPRLIKVNVGDIFTTNAIGEDELEVADINTLTDSKEVAITVPAIGTKLYIAANGYLTTTETTGPVFEVIKPFTSATKANLADNQDAVKVMRIQ